ncbi:hypothetical protein CUC08_Gglean001758 [Alternaria sp. MG1]|nr:hypothetical protein CUC08_Gglean001758 [Alternaria sp. MG1]
MAATTATMPSPIPHTSTSHPEDPIPAEPKDIPQLSVQPSQSQPEQTSPKSSAESTLWTNSSDDSEAPMTPMTEPDQGVEEVVDKLQALPTSAVNFSEQSRPRRASTTLISDNPNDIRRILVTLKTQTGRWPTIWGEDQARELVTTRRELLTWCADIQSHPPTKNLLRVLAEYADAPNEKKILTYLCSAQGQAAFCDLRTTSHFTVSQMLSAFPSSKPPLPHLLSVLTQLMPRFYSLSNDPHISSARPGLPGTRRLIEMAVTIHETPDWHAEGATRTGVGSGFMERLAHSFISTESEGVDPRSILDLRVPMFRGLMANPLSKQFGGEGPMVLIGAGVGMAPFRGFILNRLKNANCANKIWLIQGVRDSMLDELYSGELGDHEREIKKVVQSRKVKVGGSNEVKYVQDEVRVQADIVWFVINALDGRIFVCGSSKGMGEGVEESLIDVAMQKGRLSEAQAKEFWARKREDGQYIAETW